MGSIADSITHEDLDRDPYPIYAELRQHEPVAFVPAIGLWLITRWDDCASVATNRVNWVGASAHPAIERVFGRPNVLTAVGDVHKDQRAGIAPTMTPVAVRESIEDIARGLAREAIEAIGDRPTIELMSCYFEPISVKALGATMGLNEDIDADTLRRWFHGLNHVLSNGVADPTVFERGDELVAEIDEAIVPILDRLRRSPDDSMLSHMIRSGRKSGNERTDAEILPSVRVILLGGMQEPGHGAGSTLMGLLANPTQLRRVVDDHALIPAAVIEGLRWIAPIGLIERQSVGRQQVRGVDMPDATVVQLVLSSANRDPRKFADPDFFSIDRDDASHMAFGGGAHFCSGHYFSRHLERIMLEELLSAFPDLVADCDVEPDVNGYFFRAPKTLPVRRSDTARVDGGDSRATSNVP
jgi:cytochrome P450